MSRSLALKRLGFAFVALALVIAQPFPSAEAKVGGGASFGSRGVRTYSAPPPTATAPRTAAPVQRSITPATVPSAGRSSMFGGSLFGGSMFGGMFRGLLLGGILGAVFASVFGSGFLSGFLGFVLQTALIGFLVVMAVNFFRRGSVAMPQMGTMRTGVSGLGGSFQSPSVSNSRSNGGMSPRTTPLTVGPDDFSAFERLLGQIQLAYGRGDISALERTVTPEMVSYFSADLSANAQRGVRNEISDPKLLQGDLAEAWVEPGSEYASVAMRFSLLDRMVDVATGRITSGSATVPTQSTELWTFRRPANGRPSQWTLSAIQQVN